MNRFKTFIAITLALPALCSAADCTAALQPTSPIEPAGIYASALPPARNPGMAYLYSIDLWHSADCYFGILRATESREGDAPAGMVTFVRTPNNNAIAFSSKFSQGVVNLGPNGADVPSKELFEFSGTFDQKQIAGTFKYIDKLGSRPVATQKARLTLEKNSARSMALPGNAKTYAAWLDNAGQTLKVYGPKW